MASNLPPGVTVNMIPGNRPEDLAEEALAEHVAAELDKLPSRGEDDEHLIELICKLMGEARQLGREDGRDDEKLARAFWEDKLIECNKCGVRARRPADPHQLPDEWEMCGHGSVFCDQCVREYVEALAKAARGGGT